MCLGQQGQCEGRGRGGGGARTVFSVDASYLGASTAQQQEQCPDTSWPRTEGAREQRLVSDTGWGC